MAWDVATAAPCCPFASPFTLLVDPTEDVDLEADMTLDLGASIVALTTGEEEEAEERDGNERASFSWGCGFDFDWIDFSRSRMT